MTLYAVSDIHLNKKILDDLKKITGQLLLVCGDLSDCGTYSELEAVLNILSKLNFNKILVTMGNHDFDMEKNLNYYKDKYKNIIFLKNEVFELWGLKIYATPYCQEYGGWAFAYKDRFDCINKTIPKEKVDIIMCHEPPYHRSLSFINDKPYGNFELTTFLELSLKAPNVLFCGHIHEHKGASVVINNTKCFNCSEKIVSYEF